MNIFNRRRALGVIGLGFTSASNISYYLDGSDSDSSDRMIPANSNIPNGNDNEDSTIIKDDDGGIMIRSVQAKLGDIVSVTDFGAIGDGISDDTVPIQAAIDSLKNGGILLFPTGQYRITDEIVVPAVGGLIFQGEGHNDSHFGAPVPSGSGTFIFQENNNKAIFLLTGGSSYCIIRNMTLSATRNPSDSAFGTDRFGIKIEGSLPQIIWSLLFENIVFFNFAKAILCTDLSSSLIAQDLSVAPVNIRNCIFSYCATGVYINTNNADFWIYDSCFFFIPYNGIGVELVRFGLQYFYNCSGGSVFAKDNKFIRISPLGTTSVDKIILSGCQTENIKYALELTAKSVHKDLFVIEITGSVFELGSDIYLGSPVHIVSQNNRFAGSKLYIDDTAVKISTINDQFDTSGYVFLSGSAFTSFHYTVWGVKPPKHYSNYKFEDGRVYRFSGLEKDVPSGTATTLFNLPSDAGLYEVFAYLPEAGGGGRYIASMRVASDGAELAKVSESKGPDMDLTISGSNVQAIQTSGASQSISWRFQLVV